MVHRVFSGVSCPVFSAVKIWRLVAVDGFKVHLETERGEALAHEFALPRQCELID